MIGLLQRKQSEELFLELPAREQAELLQRSPEGERESWVRLLPPDDVADLVQAYPRELRESVLALLDQPTRGEVNGLLAYAGDRAGGLMSTRYARVRPQMTADEAVSCLRQQARARIETIYVAYVLDHHQRLLGVVSFRDLFAAQPYQLVQDIMRTDVVTASVEEDQEVVARLFARHDLAAIPVTDEDRRMCGIVTVDDIVDVVDEEATEDLQKFGGVSALGAPYLQLALHRMVTKRAGWLAALFMGEMLTATAMAYFQDEIARAVVLSLFVPLIISSGGNSGSQASTLVIRAMTLGEVKLRDWWRVVPRELITGLVLGAMLGAIGFLRISIWHAVSPTYGEHYLLVASTVFLSLVGVVLFGTLVGSLLPLVFQRLGLDPATASAPFVATLVDVTGIVIYFSVATMVLRGTLL